MDSFGTLPLALAAIAVGLGLLLLVWGASHWWAARPAGRAVAVEPLAPALAVQLAHLDDAVLVAETGGRVTFANGLARDWFGLDGGDPDLTVLARQANPTDSFLELFAAEGRTTLEVRAPGSLAAHRQVEATSHQLALGDEQRFVVVLRETGALPRLGSDDDPTASTLAIVAELGRTITASLDVEVTLEAILSVLARVTHYDVGEVNLWEPESQLLRARRRAGDRDYILALELLGDTQKLDESYSGWVAQHRRPLLIPDVSERADLRPRLSPASLAQGAYLGVPMQAGDVLVGTLDLISIKSNGFDESHLRLIEIVAGQAAQALLNAQRFETERRRVSELSGLAEIAQAAGSLTDSQELYARLTERIATLTGAQLCGFLLFDEQASALVAQAPFYGVPEAFVALYRIPLPAGSRMNRVWREDEFWLSNDVPNDPMIAEAGLADLAAAIGVQQTLLVPLNFGGQRLGVIQVSNKASDKAFSEGDTQQLLVLAGQVAALIDNARLVRETRVRAERAEGLRRLSVVAGSAQPLDDILRLAVEETMRLLAADLAVILLLDDARGDLVPHASSAAGVPAEFLNRSPLTRADPLYRVSVVHTRRPFLTNAAQTNQRLHPNYRALMQGLGLNGCLNVPLVVHERGIGEVLVAGRRENAYSSTDLELLSIIAAQAASAIERARLTEATDDNLNRRVRQMTALARVSQQLNRTLDLDRILTSVYDEATGEATQADYGSIVLLDVSAPGGTTLPAVLKRVGNIAAGASEPPVNGHAPTPRNSGQAPGEVLYPAEASFMGEAPDALGVWRKDSPAEGDRLAEDAHTALIVPIMYQESIGGLIHLQSRAARAFDQSVVDFVRALADQTAVAIGNAQRYDEQVARNELLRRRADQLSQLFQISRSVRADQPLAANLETIAFGVQESTAFDIVIMSLLDREGALLEPAAAAGLTLASFERIKRIARPWPEIEPLLRDEHRLSQSYFIPRRRRMVTGPLASAVRAERRPSAAPPPDGAAGWQPDDLLLIPFHGSAGEILGLMQLDEPRSRRAPDRSTIETLEIFANQAALAIESARLYQTAEERAGELSRRLSDLSASYAELDEVSRSLVQKDQELTRLVDELDLRTRRMLSLHHVTEALTSTRDPNSLLRLVAEAVTGEMQMEACLIVLRGRPEAGGPPPMRIAATAGFAIPVGANLAPLLPSNPQANPIAFTMDRNTPLLVRDVERSEWAGTTLIIGLALRAFVSVPILLGGRISGVLFVGSQKALISFTDQDLDLFNILASQIGVALENAELFAETQRGLMEQSLLYETSQDLSRTSDAQAAIAAVAERMARQLNATSVHFYAYDEPARTLRVDYQYWAPAAGPQERAPLAGQIHLIDEMPHLAAALPANGEVGLSPAQPAQRVLRQDDSQLASAERAWLADHGVQTLMALPMILQDRVLGYFEIWDTRARRAYDEADLRLVQALSNQAAVAFESARLYQQTRRFNEQLEETVDERTRALQVERDRVGTLLRITSELSASLDLDRVLQRALALVNDVVGASQGSIFLVDPQSDRLLYRAALGRPQPLPLGGEPSPFTLNDGLAGWVVKNRQAAVIDDLETDPRWIPGVAGRQHRSALAAPLVTVDDVLGVIMFFSSEPAAFNADQLSLVSAAAAQVASAINNAELYRLIRDQAERLGSMLRGQQVEASKNRAILESIADGVLVADDQGQIVLLNPAAERLLNLSHEILGKPAESFIGLYGPAGTSWSSAMESWQNDPSAYQPGDFLAERFELEDKRVISVHLAPVTSGDNYLGSVSLFRDITREVEVDRLKTEFVTTVSHELRTPLTPIKGYVDALLLGMAGPIEVQQQQILGVIKSNIDRLAILVNDLLDISRIESGKVELKLEPISMREVADEVAATLQSRIEKEGKPMRLVVDVARDLPSMMADHARIVQVMSNLVLNAYNYTPANGTITITAKVQSGVMQVSVRDSGIGIAPQNLSRIFERFYRGDDPLVLATAGTGLGLSIVRYLVEMHDGRLWAESDGIGKGSTFTYLMPLAA